MKVIYEKSIAEKISDARVKARIEGRQIERIELNRDEYDQLHEYCTFSAGRRYILLDRRARRWTEVAKGDRLLTFDGIALHKGEE